VLGDGLRDALDPRPTDRTRSVKNVTANVAKTSFDRFVDQVEARM
jgi:hypothetical protein